MEPVQLPENLSVPQYIPLYHDAYREINKTINNDVEKNIKKLVQNVKNDVDVFVKFVLENNMVTDISSVKQILQGYATVVKQFLEPLSKAKIWNNAVMETKVKYQSIAAPDFGLQNLEEFRGPQINFVDAVRQEYQNSQVLQQSRDFEAAVDGNEVYRYINSVIFILENPEEPLPDEHEEDDVMVSGGKVSFQDPIALNTFVDPYKSRRCNHVYEKEHITEHLKLNNTCPVSGCDSGLTSNDLVPDQLMQLRVKVYSVRKQDDSNVVVL